MNRFVVVGMAALGFTLIAAPALADEEREHEGAAAPQPAPTPEATPTEAAPTPSQPVEEVAPPPPPPPTPPPATNAPVTTVTNANPIVASTAMSSGLPKGEKVGGEARDPNAGEHFRIGPLVGVGFPRPLAVEALVKIERVVGIGAEYSFLPKVNLFGAETSFKAVAADVRVFPFKGAFFFGTRVGRQWLDAKTTMTVGQGGTTVGSFTESMDAATWFVNPRLGFLKTWDSGITLGIDAGIQFPINPTYERAGAATTAGLSNAGVDNTLRSVAGALGNNITPTIDMLRLGFMF